MHFIFVLCYVLFLCDCVLPPGDNPIAVNKYNNNSKTEETNIHAVSVIRTRDPRNQEPSYFRLRLHGHRDRPALFCYLNNAWCCVWNVMAHAQKPDFVFRRNGRVHLNRRGRQFGWLLAAEMCASAVVMIVMLDTPCSEVVWRILAAHSIRQFPLHFPFRVSPCAITFQLGST
jgi:hypothetical protein